MPKLADWLAREIAAQRENLFLWAPVFIAVGIGAYFALPFEPPLWPGAFLLFGLACLLAAAWRWPLAHIFILIALLANLGFVAAEIKTIAAYTPILKKELGPVEVTGTVQSVETLEGQKGERIILRDLEIEKMQAAQTPARIRLVMRKTEDFTPGERVKLLAQLTPTSPPVAPGAFDFRRFFYFESIGALGFVYKKLETVSQPHNGFSDVMEVLRARVAARIAGVIGPGEAPMSIAFTTGQRAAIAESDKDAMVNAGLAHLISISGLHISLFSAIVFFVSRFLMACVPGFALKRPIKKYAAVLAFCAAAFYTALAGGSVPTVRSLISVGIIYLAVMFDRSPVSLRLLAAAAIILLLAAPDSLVSASFQMSFAAVAALIIFYDWIRPTWSAWHARAGLARRSVLYVVGVCLTSIVATLATAPFSLFHFQQMALYSALANAVAVPLSTFIIMPAIVFALFLMPVHLDYLPLKALEIGMAGVLWVAHWTSDLPHAVFYAPVWPTSALIVCACGAGFMMLWKGWLRVLGVIPVLASLLIIYYARPPDIFIAQDFRLAAFRSSDGVMYASQARKDKFALESWQSSVGHQDEAAEIWPKEGRTDFAGGAISCDESACRLEMKNHRVSFLKNPQAFASECAWSEVIISFDVLKNSPCPGAVVKDMFSGFDEGAQAFWLEPQGIKIKTVVEERGRRPWSEAMGKGNED